MALVVEKADFKHILRILNTNVDGRQKVVFALTKIRGIGRRFSDMIVKRAEINPAKRAGELTDDEVETVKAIIAEPRQFDIPDYFLNRQKSRLEGKMLHIVSNQVDSKLREDYERMKKVRVHRGLRHYWNLRVRGQHTCTTGRHGRTVGLARRLNM